MNEPTSPGSAGSTGGMEGTSAMLDCTAAECRLQRFLDRELTAAEQAEVRVHLEHCQNCRSRFRFEAELRRLVRQAGRQEAAPEGLRARVQQHLQRPRASS